jgi:hypothetical protein
MNLALTVNGDLGLAAVCRLGRGDAAGHDQHKNG